MKYTARRIKPSHLLCDETTSVGILSKFIQVSLKSRSYQLNIWVTALQYFFVAEELSL